MRPGCRNWWWDVERSHVCISPSCMSASRSEPRTLRGSYLPWASGRALTDHVPDAATDKPPSAPSHSTAARHRLLQLPPSSGLSPKPPLTNVRGSRNGGKKSKGDCAGHRDVPSCRATMTDTIQDFSQMITPIWAQCLLGGEKTCLRTCDRVVRGYLGTCHFPASPYVVYQSCPDF